MLDRTVLFSITFSDLKGGTRGAQFWGLISRCMLVPFDRSDENVETGVFPWSQPCPRYGTYSNQIFHCDQKYGEGQLLLGTQRFPILVAKNVCYPAMCAYIVGISRMLTRDLFA